MGAGIPSGSEEAGARRLDIADMTFRIFDGKPVLEVFDALEHFPLDVLEATVNRCRRRRPILWSHVPSLCCSHACRCMSTLRWVEFGEWRVISVVACFVGRSGRRRVTHTGRGRRPHHGVPHGVGPGGTIVNFARGRSQQKSADLVARSFVAVGGGFKTFYRVIFLTLRVCGHRTQCLQPRPRGARDNTKRRENENDSMVALCVQRAKGDGWGGALGPPQVRTEKLYIIQKGGRKGKQ